MKNIYKHLNNIEIDMAEFEEIEISEFKRAKVKKELMNKIHVTKQKKWKTSVIAASLTLSLITSALFGLSFTANAKEIPIIGNIFKLFSYDGLDGLNEDYKENSNPINEVAESNGIKITVNDAIYDGESLILTYTVETNKYMGDTLHITGLPHIENEEENGNHKVIRIGENKYVGKATTISKDEYSSINVKWTINYILSDLTTDRERIIGDWNFNFKLNKADITVQNINQHKEQDGITINLEKLTITPMSFLINFKQVISKEITEDWENSHVDLDVKDDLGNVYQSKYFGGTGSGWGMNMNKTFQTLDPDASKLIITPKVTLSDYDGVEYNEDGSIRGRYRSLNSKADIKEFKMDKIIVEIEK